MQQTINIFFEQPWTEVDVVTKQLDRVTGVPEYFGNWRYNQQILSLEKPALKLWWEKLNRKVLKLYSLEDCTSNLLEICEQIKNLTFLDYKSDQVIPSFEELHQKSPKYYRSRQVDDFQKDYTAQQLNLIQELHGFAMEKLDYSLI
ncbi:MAG: hypothetical protein ACRC8A_12255 [Microcoleaceae cyanobacterium]